MSLKEFKEQQLIPQGTRRRKVDPSELYAGESKMKLLRTSVMLPSQYNAYAVCVEFAKDWFLSKFPQKFFNSIYVDGSKSFAEFRALYNDDKKLRKTNPVLAIMPNINLEHNRNWIDTNMNLTGYMRRSRMEGRIFADQRPDHNYHIAVQFKSILMQFGFKIRIDTRAQQLDLAELIKYKHRAGMTETQYIPLDIHVPKKIIAQLAYDNGMALPDFSGPKNPRAMLKYLNSYSFVPFLYKRRNATGTNEYFIRVDNCIAHIKAEMPTIDDGNRQDMEHMNYTIEFNIEVEMTAPYCFIYYSEKDQDIINSNEILTTDTAIIVMKAVKADLPECNERGWNRLAKSGYLVEMEDIKPENQPVVINFKDLVRGDMFKMIEYTKSVALNPGLFIDFIIFNNTNDYVGYTVNWSDYTITINDIVRHPGFTIGVYVDMNYVNNTFIHHDGGDGFNAQDSFRHTSRIGKIEEIPNEGPA